MSSIEKLLVEDLKDIEKKLASVYPINIGVEQLWSDESEERIRAYVNGNIPILTEKATFAKYKS